MSETATTAVSLPRRSLHYWKGIPVPFIICWNREVEAVKNQTGPGAMIKMVGTSPGGLLRVSYSDEWPYDRDRHGVLWQRYPIAMYQGDPHFAKVHPSRQRRCMAKRLCQVCGNPASFNEDGWLWLVTHEDAARLRAGGEQRVRTANPPVCERCSELARTLCPNLLKGNALVRANTVTDWGVYGLKATPDGAYAGHTVAYDDPAVIQIVAGQQLVIISDLTLIS